MYPFLQKLLFQLDPEKAHELTISSLKATQHNWLRGLYRQDLPAKPVELFGLTFKNPVGLAAGLDKNGECIDAFAAMGFGYIEVGTVTPRPQPGNEKPRLFRLPEAGAIINRMGFNNHGVDYLVEQVNNADFDGVLGINIGKNKTTEEKDALQDYLICLEKVYQHAGYITINISSPNTPGLRNLQHGEALQQLLSGIKSEQEKLSDKHGKYVPVLVKIAPDLSDEELSGMAQTFIDTGVDGVIATNTTLERNAVKHLQHGNEAGGLSGAVLTQQSQQICEKLVQILDGAMPVIGVGGIDSSASAQERLNSGAKLIQIYSSMIYKGPDLIKEIVESL